MDFSSLLRSEAEDKIDWEPIAVDVLRSFQNETVNCDTDLAIDLHLSLYLSGNADNEILGEEIPESLIGVSDEILSLGYKKWIGIRLLIKSYVRYCQWRNIDENHEEFDKVAESLAFDLRKHYDGSLTAAEIEVSRFVKMSEIARDLVIIGTTGLRTSDDTNIILDYVNRLRINDREYRDLLSDRTKKPGINSELYVHGSGRFDAYIVMDEIAHTLIVIEKDGIDRCFNHLITEVFYDFVDYGGWSQTLESLRVIDRDERDEYFARHNQQIFFDEEIRPLQPRRLSYPDEDMESSSDDDDEETDDDEDWAIPWVEYDHANLFTEAIASTIERLMNEPSKAASAA